MAAIWKMVIFLYLGHESSDFVQIRYEDAQFDSENCQVRILQLQDSFISPQWVKKSYAFHIDA